MNNKQSVIKLMNMYLRKVKWDYYAESVIINNDQSVMSYKFLRGLVAIELNGSYQFNNVLGTRTILQKDLVDTHFVRPDKTIANKFLPTQNYTDYVNMKFSSKIRNKANTEVEKYHQQHSPRALRNKRSEDRNQTNITELNIILESSLVIFAGLLCICIFISNLYVGIIPLIIVASNVLIMLIRHNTYHETNNDSNNSVSTLGTPYPIWYYTSSHQEYLSLILDFMCDKDTKIQLFDYELEIGQQIKRAHTHITKMDFVIFLNQHHIWQYDSCDQLPELIDHSIFEN